MRRIVIPRLKDMKPFVYEDTTPGPPVPMCGPSALSTVCEALGRHTTADEIARLAGTDWRGTTLYGLREAAEAKGLTAYGVQADLAYLRKTKKPVIAWIGRDHYVVITGFDGWYVHYQDPSSGGVSRTAAGEFAQIWDGYMLVVRDANRQKGRTADREGGR